MFERFTDRARRVLVLAQEEARNLQHNYIGTEHLLLGLIHEREGVGATALEAIGIKLNDVRRQVEEIIGHGQQAPSGHIPFTPRCKKVLELALREALQLGNNYVGTEHLLLGLIREGEGVAAQVLVRLSADLNSVRQRVLEILSGRAQEKPLDLPPNIQLCRTLNELAQKSDSIIVRDYERVTTERSGELTKDVLTIRWSPVTP